MSFAAAIKGLPWEAAECKEPILISIDGAPVPYAASRKGKTGWYNPRSEEKAAVQWKIKRQYSGPLIRGPVSVHYTFHMPIPKSWSKSKKIKAATGFIPHVSKPDIDNLMKFYNDCLQNTVIFNDNLIVQLEPAPMKKYSILPNTTIVIKPL